MAPVQRIQVRRWSCRHIHRSSSSTVESVDANQMEVSQLYDRARVEGREHDPQVVRKTPAAIEPGPVSTVPPG